MKAKADLEKKTADLESSMKETSDKKERACALEKELREALEAEKARVATLQASIENHRKVAEETKAELESNKRDCEARVQALQKKLTETQEILSDVDCKLNEVLTDNDTTVGNLNTTQKVDEVRARRANALPRSSVASFLYLPQTFAPLRAQVKNMVDRLRREKEETEKKLRELIAHIEKDEVSILSASALKNAKTLEGVGTIFVLTDEQKEKMSDLDGVRGKKVVSLHTLDDAALNAIRKTRTADGQIYVCADGRGCKTMTDFLRDSGRKNLVALS